MTAVNEDDDIEQFVARTIVHPPPPLNCVVDDVTPSGSHASYTDNANNGDITVTSAGGGHVTSNRTWDANTRNSLESYPRAGCIDKTTDMYVNLPQRRASDLAPASSVRPLVGVHPCHYMNASIGVQPSANSNHSQCQWWQCGYGRRSLRWYDASYDYLRARTDDRTGLNVAVCSAASLRPISLQHESVSHTTHNSLLLYRLSLSIAGE